ncbi:MAG: DUF4375 domain-containing protein [Phycisphaerales bacterium]|nr:MAG: DUF4375 domain-containing protein [Phycisphaerales bacterium]
MSFRDFITNWRYRNSADAMFDRYDRIQAPANPSPRHLAKLVRQLSQPKNAWFAKRELELIGAAAAPALAQAARSRAWQPRRDIDELLNEPLVNCLELLVPHDPETVIEVTSRLADSRFSDWRGVAALQAASLGRIDTLPLLRRLLLDEDEGVRESVSKGLVRACGAQALTSEFRTAAFDHLISSCAPNGKGPDRACFEAMIALDRKRAAQEFASRRWINRENPDVVGLLRSCNEAEIQLPAELVRDLFDDSLPRVTGDSCYPHCSIAAESLRSLTSSLGEAARPLLMSMLNHDHEKLQVASAAGLAMLVGLKDPAYLMFQKVSQRGLDTLNPPQRVVHFASTFEFQVGNGGLAQFFANSSGDHVPEIMEALRILGHPEAIHALVSAVDLVGPIARERDREIRLTAFEDRYDELRQRFEPLEDAFYATIGRFQQSLLLYAAEHADKILEP